MNVKRCCHLKKCSERRNCPHKCVCNGMKGFVEERKKSTKVLQEEEARKTVGCSPTKLCGDREAKRTCMQSGFREVEGDAEVEGSCVSQNLNAEEFL